MKRESVFLMVFLIILVPSSFTALEVQRVEASGTIYIRDDGSIDPPTANITSLDNVTYTLIGNINDSIVIERDNIVIDGAGYTVQGTGSGTGITLSGRSNVTIKNTEITNNVYGISLNSSSNSSISGNNITNNSCGISLYSPSNYNSIYGNNITANNEGGIRLYSSNYNSIHGNNITANSMGDGISLHDSSSYNSIRGNNITANSLALYGTSSFNSVHGNNITANNIYLYSSNNSIYHNNFANNTNHIEYSSMNVWDDGYPSGGNYWNDYTGNDVYNGAGRDQLGSDGIGDALYTIDMINKDRYPFMAPIDFFDVGVWNGESQEVHVISNSTISNFQVNETEKTIDFNVAGEAGSGFCGVIIPNLIKQELWGGNCTVLVDEKRVETGNWTDAENTYIYFTYEHSEHNVTILQAYTTTLQIEATTGGTTDPPPDLCFYLIGDVVSVLAIPDSNYRFEYWILNGVNISSQDHIEVLMDSNHSLQAVFTPITHQLNITSTEGGTTDPAPGTHTYLNGTVVSVTALPDVGYSFNYWRREGEVRTVNPIIILAAADGTLEAFFFDDIRPEIGEPVQDPPEDVEPHQTVTVTVNVTDLGTGVYNVTLWYSVDNRTSWTPLNMTDISQNTYQTTIPGHENCTWVSYKIVAYDKAGNQAVNDNHSYHKYYVIPEFPSFIILPLFFIATLLAVIAARRKPR